MSTSSAEKGDEIAEYWNRTVDIANRTRRLLDDKPKHLRIGYSLHPGAILNAYREGDATLDEAVEAIRAIESTAVVRLQDGVRRWCERTEAGNAMEAPVDQRCTRELRALLGPDNPCTCWRCKP